MEVREHEPNANFSGPESSCPAVRRKKVLIASKRVDYYLFYFPKILFGVEKPWAGIPV